TAVTGHGLEVAFDDGPLAVLDADFVSGCRTDGTPNLSHSWARTVAGAQGGTWAQVHLLGTPTLDRFTGYVGQSRGRQPTHTWNTRADVDYPARLLAHDRTPDEAVRDALQRDEPKTLAAIDDPYVVDRALRSEPDQHTPVI